MYARHTRRPGRYAQGRYASRSPYIGKTTYHAACCVSGVAESHNQGKGAALRWPCSTLRWSWTR
ncbi:hypothetical protein [Vibrio phage VP882]|uniref:Uncharacterized protein n=1 Tax=Vibrio phage VP882 TaxID=2913982 RepID=A2I314_9CAUD|nr:hypothetical protein VPVV882_gp66 [Vibrio phage VP882]ABM73426.1 hypothetical protein [Vibrio phage VP882]